MGIWGHLKSKIQCLLTLHSVKVWLAGIQIWEIHHLIRKCLLSLYRDTHTQRGGGKNRERERGEKRQRGRERKREGKIKGAKVREETDERREIQRKRGEGTLRWNHWEDGERDQRLY